MDKIVRMTIISVHQESASHLWDIPWYTHQKRCITSVYKVDITFESVDEILQCVFSLESYCTEQYCTVVGCVRWLCVLKAVDTNNIQLRAS